MLLDILMMRAEKSENYVLWSSVLSVDVVGEKE